MSLRAQFGLQGVARRTLGIALLLVVVFLWTLSNFLASVSIASDLCSFRSNGLLTCVLVYLLR